jgi:quercetin dioxygenase-like cupin family protein
MKRQILFCLLATLLTAQSTPEVEITAEPDHHLTFENKSVRVFNVEVPPHADTLMHWHRHDYIFVTLGATEVVNSVKDKPPVTLKLQDGETRFSPAPFAHTARNLSDRPFRNVTIEILDDATLRNATSPWDPAKNEDRGLLTFSGGTKQILFVKDAIRVSEVELQPGAAIPTRSPSHPLLLVALTDFDLFTNDPRTHGPPEPDPTPSHFHAGTSIWLPYGFGRPIVASGPHSAKFVTLEFP